MPGERHRITLLTAVPSVVLWRDLPLRMNPTSRPIEILEARIAPAVFFISRTELKIVDSGGNDVDVASATGAVGATKSVLLHAGDSLIADTNGNHKADKGEATLIKVTAGSAIAFFTDANTN